METILIKNAVVVTQDDERRVLRDADILIEGDVVAEVGRDLPGPADMLIDASKKVAIPGLINAHTHIAMTLFRGVADDMELMKWLKEKIWPLESNLTREDVLAGAKLGILEALRGGTTCFADMYFFEDAVAEAAVELGARGILASSYIDFGTPEARDG
ncbi:MAG: hypothetical protein DRO06_04575, partial [Thermoproteota archaeon]